MDPGQARAGGGPPDLGEAGRERSAADVAPAGDADEGLPPVPWHLKLLVGAVALYLGWRAFQGIDWVVRQL